MRGRPFRRPWQRTTNVPTQKKARDVGIRRPAQAEEGHCAQRHVILSRLKEPLTVVARLVVCHLTEEISHARRHPLACRCSVGGDHRPAPDWSTALVTGAGSRLNQLLNT